MAKARRHDHGPRMLHVIGRAVHGDALFPDDDYAHMFWNEIGRRSLEFDVQILAMCLLGNHYHLIVRGSPDDLATTMHRGLSKVANIRNRADERRGALVGRRYHVVPVRDARHRTNLIRYVPLNPVLHRLTDDPAKWRWSTHAILTGKRVAPEWLDRDEVLRAFGFVDGRSYERFVLANTQLRLPPMTSLELRDHRVLVLLDAGLDVAEVASIVGCSERHVRRVRARRE